ncbi:MAG: hypothetical protein E6G15_10100 [Actinobacteria bacterium]|nr:MAG: hypothetical protein E6G15_10100 [Actinomycetota bacterium]
MRRLAVGLLSAASVVTVALVLAAVLEPGKRSLELDIYVLVIGAMAVLTAVLAARRAYPLAARSAIAEALEDEPRTAIRPPDLDRTERVLSMATNAAFDVHFRLRPILREVAEQRLADRRGLREALGDELWELVRPDREPPNRRFGEGIEVEQLARVLDRLEAV